MRYIIKGGVWKNSEDEILKAAVMKYGLNQWSRISSLLVRKSAKQCKQRWYEWLDPSIKKTEWTREEEEKLLHLAKIFPSQWRTIAPIVGRTPMQCVEKYEKLLDQAQGKDSTDPNDPRRLRPGEIDPNPETKPARPDPIDMDEDEKEMLAEARVRLANTKGKKAKRKARGKLIEEARRLAFLQKKRELKAAGLEYVNHRVEKPFIIRKLNLQLQGIDYNKEIAFERMVPEFVFKPSEDENPDTDKKLSNVSLQQLEGKRRDEEEEAKRKIDQRRMKKLKDRELDQAVTLYNKTTNLLNLKKTKMMLPEPQLKDQDLELLGKLNAVNEVSEHSHLSSRALIGNYSQRESSLSVMRTPKAPNTVMREAQNIIALQQTETPLVGGENAQLQQSSFNASRMGLTPQTQAVSTPNELARLLRTPNTSQQRVSAAQTPNQSQQVAQSQKGRRGFLSETAQSQTPVHDAFRLHTEDYDRSWDEQSHQEQQSINQEKLQKLRAIQARQQVLQGLKNLSQPKNEFTVIVPELSQMNNEHQDTVMDAEDVEKLNKEKNSFRKQQKTSASLRNLMPPRNLPSKLYNIDNSDSLRNQLETILSNNVLQLIEEDNTNEGQILGDISQVRKLNIIKLFKGSLLLKQEIANLKQNSMECEEDVNVIWDGLRKNVEYDETVKQFVNIQVAENKLDIFRQKYLRKSFILSRLEKRNSMLGGKLQMLLKGYQFRMSTLEKEISVMNQTIAEYNLSKQIYTQALQHERKCYRDRIDEVAKFHDMLLVKNNELQRKHQSLIQQRQEIFEDEGLFCSKYEEVKE